MNSTIRSRITAQMQAGTLHFQSSDFRFHLHDFDSPESMRASLQVSSSVFTKLCSELWPGRKHSPAGLEILEPKFGWYQLRVLSPRGVKALTGILHYLWKKYEAAELNSRKSSRGLFEKARAACIPTPSYKQAHYDEQPTESVLREIRRLGPNRFTSHTIKRPVLPVVAVNNDQPIKSVDAQLCDILREVLSEQQNALAGRITDLARTINSKFGH